MSAVTDQLTKWGVSYELVPHEQAYTSTDEALALGISADEVVKTVVLDIGSGHALAVIPGSRRLDIRAAERAVGAKHVRLATEEEIEKEFPGSELGAIPPLGSLYDTPTYVDPEVMRRDTLVFAAGTQTASVRVRTEDLFGNEPVTVAPMTRISAADEDLIEQVEAMIKAYVLVQVRVGRSAEVASEVARIESVLSSDVVNGPYDVIALAEAADIDDLGELVVARIQAVDGVTRTLTCPVMKL
jgi:Cys-tRNA(Pro) deacylase